MHKLIIAIPIYLFITTILWCTKPAITYDHTQKEFRPFGTGKRATLLPMWLLSMLVAVLAYMASHFGTSLSLLWDGQRTRTLVSNNTVPATNPSIAATSEEYGRPEDTVAADLLADMAMGHMHSIGARSPLQPTAPLVPTAPTAPNSFQRRRTMTGGGTSARVNTDTRERRLTNPRKDRFGQRVTHTNAHRINTRGTRHADAKLRRTALQESRVWKSVMQ